MLIKEMFYIGASFVSRFLLYDPVRLSISSAKAKTRLKLNVRLAHRWPVCRGVKGACTLLAAMAFPRRQAGRNGVFHPKRDSGKACLPFLCLGCFRLCCYIY
jgi:hypothetical protein